MKKEKTMYELCQEFPDKTYQELESYRDNDRRQEAGVCVMGEMKKDREEVSWQEKYNKEHKLRQEAEIALANALAGDHRQKEADELMMQKLERIQDLEQINESHQKLNGKLQERLTELEEENKKMHEHFDKKIDSARKAGM